MKLNKIYISAFGGLKDFTLDLNDGLNVIYGNNEDGKSTVAAFIKAMFYGTGRNSTKGISESVRLKYTPWDNSTMAGRIFFEHQNKKYCLEREFRKSDATDRITLTDLDSGKAVDTGDNIGQRFFGLSAAAFERSLFIGNGDFIKDETAAGEINGKLSNIALTGNEDVSYTKVKNNIEDTCYKIISKNKKGGAYNEALQELELLKSRLANAENDAKLKTQLNNQAQEKLAEYETLNKKHQELKSIVEREQDIKNRERLVEFLETKRNLDELNRTLTLPNGTVINESLTSKIEFSLNRYKTSVDRLEQITQDIAQINETIALQNSSPEATKEQLEALKGDANNLEAQKSKYDADEKLLFARINELKQELDAAQNKKAKINPLFLCLAIVLTAAGGVLAAAFNVIIGSALIGLGVILLILSFIIKPKNTSAIATAQNRLAEANNNLAEIKSAKNTAQEQINNIDATVNRLNSILQADTTIKQQRLDDLAKKQELLQAEQEKANLLKDELFAALSDIDTLDSIDKIEAKLYELKQKVEQLKNIKLQLKTASQYLGGIDYDEAQQKLDAMQSESDNVDLDAVKAEFDEVTNKLSAVKDRITTIATELKASFKNSENPEEIKREIKALQEKIDSVKAFYDAAKVAQDVLEESFYELRRGYGSELEKATHEIFARLTNGKYKSVNVSESLDLSVENADVFGTHELDYLSLGATHQAYLSLRLAIATLISDDKLPIFLDDSLSQYDDTRTERAITFLKEFCTDGQGILFTCHNSICDMAQKAGIEIHKPYNCDKLS